MTKDDYEIVAYKILIYLYACMKRKVIFDLEVFNKAIRKNVLNDEYMIDILRLMTDEGLIKGLTFQKVWGREYIMVSDMADAEITAEGIRYIKDNSKTGKIKNTLTDSADIIASLIGILNI